jgi:hypothetical protein
MTKEDCMALLGLPRDMVYDEQYVACVEFSVPLVPCRLLRMEILRRLIRVPVRLSGKCGRRTSGWRRNTTRIRIQMGMMRAFNSARG